MVMWPGAGLRNGDLDVSDIRDFPGNLRCLLKVKAVLTGGDFDLGDHCVFAGEVQVTRGLPRGARWVSDTPVAVEMVS